MEISISKNWTEGEVWAAEEQYILNGGEFMGIYSPFHRWTALHRLDEYQLRYENGDKFCLMLAIRTCAQYEFVMPKWVASAYLEAIRPVMDYEHKSWNEAFGNPVPKGAIIQSLREKYLLEGRVYLELRNIILQNPERAIDVNLFEEVGEIFGIGKTAAEKYYRSFVKKGVVDSLAEVKKKIDSPRYRLLINKI